MIDGRSIAFWLGVSALTTSVSVVYVLTRSVAITASSCLSGIVLGLVHEAFKSRRSEA